VRAGAKVGIEFEQRDEAPDPLSDLHREVDRMKTELRQLKASLRASGVIE
jgi:hypothetical protein